MECPQCQSEEIDPSGICLVCGYQIPAASDEKKGFSFSGMIEMDYSEGAEEPPPKEELPQWRRELSERLQAIKQQKQAAASSKTQAAAPRVQAPTPKPVPKPAPRPVVRPPMPAPRQKTLQPLESVSIEAKPALSRADEEEVQRLIDTVVSRQSLAASEAASPAPEPFPREGKLILLSRTLSGLVDLVIVVLRTGGCILAADFFSGIVVLDSVSAVDFSVLFVLTYFVYSMFFMVASGQTIGMMLTDLRLIGIDHKRPSLGQMLGRSFGYLVSLFGLCIGLLWSLFNSENLCFHDRLSSTRVIRI